MTRSIDETRREFLFRLAKAAVFVPPALASLDVERAAAMVQGGGKTTTGGGGGGGGKGNNTTTVGSTSASTQQVQNTTFQTRGQNTDQRAPWNPGSSAPAPWQRPPPTGSGDGG